MKKRVIFEIVFVAAVFLLGYGRFLPVPFAPDILHEFFNRNGWVFTYLNVVLLGGFLLVAVIRSCIRGLDAREIVLALSALMVYIGLWFLIPTFRYLDHRITMAINENKTPENFSNPILGFQMGISTGCDMRTYFRHDPDSPNTVIITSRSPDGTLIFGIPCQDLKYVSYTANEIGLTETWDHLTYLPAPLNLLRRESGFEDSSHSYDANWTYTRSSAALKLF